MSTTTHASLAIVLNKQGTPEKEDSVKSSFFYKKFISSFCIVLSFAIINISPANARFLSSVIATEANFSQNNYQVQINDISCDNGDYISFAYRQRIIINGKTEFVLAEYLYPSGVQPVYLVEITCDGLYLYEAGSCSCKNSDLNLRTDLKKCYATDFRNTVATLIKENVQKEIADLGQLQLIKTSSVPKPTGFLYIRKKVMRKETINIV